MPRWRVENPRESEEDLYEDLGPWDRIVVWWYEVALPQIKGLFGFGNGPRGGLA
jgi:hypothetical protein